MATSLQAKGPSGSPVELTATADGKLIIESPSGSSGSSGSAGGTIGIDANGTQWMMVVDTTATTATITYFKVADGTTGTPVGGFTPDADQNGATSALQTAGNSSLTSIDGKTPALVTGRVPVDGSGVTQPVSAASLPLPTGAATEVTLSAANAWLSGIFSKLPALVSGRSPVVSSVPNVSSGTILGLTTNATGTTYTAFASTACTALDIVNNTGTTVEYRRGGAGTAMQIPTGAARMVIGITNANQVDVRRTDTSNTTVAIQAEAFVL